MVPYIRMLALLVFLFVVAEGSFAIVNRLYPLGDGLNAVGTLVLAVSGVCYIVFVFDLTRNWHKTAKQ